MAAQTSIWIQIPWQQSPVMHRMEDLHCSAINKGKEKHQKLAICLADPTRQVAFLIHMVNFLITRVWAGLSHPLLKHRKTKHCRNILDATETRCTNLIGRLLFEQFFHFCFEEVLWDPSIFVFIREKGSKWLNGGQPLSQRKVKRRMLFVGLTAERNQRSSSVF